MPFWLAEQTQEWSLMIFCARGTRGRGLPSLDARSGRSISPHSQRENKRAWREHAYRSTRAVKDSLGRSSKERYQEFDSLSCPGFDGRLKKLAIGPRRRSTSKRQPFTKEFRLEAVRCRNHRAALRRQLSVDSQTVKT